MYKPERTDTTLFLSIRSLILYSIQKHSSHLVYSFVFDLEDPPHEIYLNVKTFL